MAGHSKFKNIQHRKGAQDKKRAKIFARLTKEIMVAAKMGCLIRTPIRACAPRFWRRARKTCRKIISSGPLKRARMRATQL
jgi:hypothetical protein